MGQQNNSRRKFLSTSVATPVVLTVQSASATVTPPSSSSLCRTNDLNKPLPPAGYVQLSGEAPDLWVRRSVQVYELEVNGESKGPHIRGFNDAIGSNYWRLDGTSATISPYVFQGQGVKETATGTMRNALVLVDGSGTQVAFAWQNNVAGQKITVSCWTSFK